MRSSKKNLKTVVNQALAVLPVQERAALRRLMNGELGSAELATPELAAGLRGLRQGALKTKQQAVA